MNRVEMQKLRKGDDLVMTSKGISMGMMGRTRNITGTFVRISRKGLMVVQREGIKSPDYWHCGFWSKP